MPKLFYLQFLFCIILFISCESIPPQKINVGNVFITQGECSAKVLKKIRKIATGKQNVVDSHRFDVQGVGLYDIPGWRVSMNDSLSNPPPFIRDSLKKEIYYKKFIDSNPNYQFSLQDTDYSNIDIRPNIISIFPLELSSFEVDTPIYKKISAPLLHYRYSNMAFSGNIKGVNLINFTLESDTNNFSLIINHNKKTERCYYSLTPSITTYSAIRKFHENNFVLAVFLYKGVTGFIWCDESLWTESFVKCRGHITGKKSILPTLYLITIKYDGTIENIKRHSLKPADSCLSKEK